MNSGNGINRIAELEAHIQKLTENELIELANLYASCETVEKALSYLKKEALNEWSVRYCAANNVLGVWYYTGKYVEKNYKKAKQHYEKAAYEGHVYAEYNLGLFYFEGKEESSDYLSAIFWLESAAKKNYLPALRLLAEAYFRWGGNLGLSGAIRFGEKAAANGDKKAIENLKRYREAMRKVEIRKAEIENTPPWYAGSLEKIYESLGVETSQRDEDMLDQLTEMMGFMPDGSDG